MQISREDVIYTMDRAMSEGNVLSENIEAAQREIQSVTAMGPVDGTWYITSHRPIIGKLIILVKRFMRKMLHGYIPPVVEKFNQIEVSQNRVLQHLASAVEELSVRLVTAEKERAICQEHIKVLEQDQKDCKKRIEILEWNQKSYKELIEILEQKLEELTGKFQQAEDVGTFKMKDELSDIFAYVEFENRYRGDAELIRKRQNVYLEYFAGRESVLDLGCGRGEFLTLLRENGIPGKGIDLTDDMVSYCKALGLDVEYADIFEYLKQVEDGALDGVFCSQVVEHFTTQQLFRLIQLLNKKVRIGAPVIIETINPGNLTALANWFYMDLSHIRPVHSSTLSFLMETNGFPLQKILYLHPDTDREVPRLNMEGTEEFNDKMQNVNQLLFGAQDYAIVAFRQ